MHSEKKMGKFLTLPVLISFIVLGVIIIATLLAPCIAQYNPVEINMSEALQGPSEIHYLGTDKTGRDIFSRLIYGGRTTLVGAIGVLAISIVVGIPIGLFSGYFGGKVDTLIMRVCDIIVSFPSLLLAFVFVSSFGRGIFNAVLALGIIYIPMLAKLTRSLVMVEINKTYVEAAHSIGYSNMKIIFLEILPNCISTILAQLTLDMGYAIIDLAAMSFLGLGVQPPTADWGYMLEEGRTFIKTYPIMALAPGMAIITTVISINIISDGLQAYLDPSQRKLPSMKKFKRMVGLEHE